MFPIDNGEMQMEIDRVVIFLKEHGKRIRSYHDTGKDSLATNIIKTYHMLHTRPEQACLGILQGMIEDYKKREGIK